MLGFFLEGMEEFRNYLDYVFCQPFLQHLSFDKWGLNSFLKAKKKHLLSSIFMLH